MSILLDHIDRVPANFISSKVKEVLPEHFATEYPSLVAFLESYYDEMDRDGSGFSYFITALYQARDLNSAELVRIDSIFEETGLSVKTADFNINPRLVGKLFATLYREKGSLNSAKTFFRAFYNEEVDVEYPKNNMFIINESRIGPDSLRFIQDDKRFQIHSILIKSGVGLATWETLYKKFVHPAGWYVAADLVLEGIIDLRDNLATMPLSIEDSAAGNRIFETVADVNFGIFEPLSVIRIDDLDSDLYAERVNPYRNLASVASITGTAFDANYNSFQEYRDMNGPRFDMDSDGIVTASRFSTELETMDAVNFDMWDSDNNNFQYQDSA
tara:strand:+ start:3954 stop:4940 length:987 start_codon:yes stop_codon:yes gene_type:complete